MQGLSYHAPLETDRLHLVILRRVLLDAYSNAIAQSLKKNKHSPSSSLWLRSLH